MVVDLRGKQVVTTPAKIEFEIGKVVNDLECSAKLSHRRLRSHHLLSQVIFFKYFGSCECERKKVTPTDAVNPLNHLLWVRNLFNPLLFGPF